MRTEKDFIGEKEIPANALYGIHSLRAQENFPDKTAFHKEWYKAIGTAKLACYQTYLSFKNAVAQKYPGKKFSIPFIKNEIIDKLSESAVEVADGMHFDSFIVPAIQGGAGTSINLNVNEIITNLALQKLGECPGDYSVVDPFEHANIFQSTNDVIPTSLKVAVIRLLENLEERINQLRFKVEEQERKHRNSLRVAYTQMQEAVPSSYGMLFSTYSDALSRDWWRVSKCFERIKVVNLGGSAIGTGISVPRFFIMEVVPALQKLTKLPITRSENLSDATNNVDSFVEVHAILKSHAVNLEKMVNDIRLLASDIGGKSELNIPQKQVGSSIMPGKVNPVIPEFVIGVAHKIYSNDMLISNLSAQGCLDLNAYLPVIGHAILESLKLLIAANKSLSENLFQGLTIDTQKAVEKLYRSPSVVTALSPFIGYHKASQLAYLMKSDELNIFEANQKLNLIEDKKLEELMQPQKLLQTGFSMTDL
ncbi:MAG: lyase family protein [Bacteroidota bacterium]|nr:lyase family protein [Bacteroidota bacterium]